MYTLIRPLLFRLQPETAHDLVLGVLGLASRWEPACRTLGVLCGARTMENPVHAMGIDFPNPVGLAAGLDKQGDAANALAHMGFGWIELGTVTPKPQPGNPRPRLFRLEEERALINRMGFNSCGMDRFLGNLGRLRADVVRGINIGKNAATPLSAANDDYGQGLRDAFDHAHYVAINISSPNTRDLRSLQQPDAMDGLLGFLNDLRLRLSDQKGKHMPLVVKIAPDLDAEDIDNICALLRKHGIDGVAATNTTLARPSVQNHPLSGETGGLSGPPLRERATEIVSLLHRNLQGEIPIIGVGGIESAESAREKFQAGASLVQLYTGLIYHGPALVQRIVRGLDAATGNSHRS